jgi:hypothetical protein
MGKLLQRLSDAAKSGVYRTARADDVLDAARGSGLRVAQIDVQGATEKAALLERISSALQFPAYFGRNWDGLEDCLSDLSWAKATGHVLLFEGAQALPADERGILVDILASTAAYWAERKRPFFAVFLDGAPNLPELYKSRR